MTERRDHVIRATLPWRREQLTECGRALDDVASFISRDELVARVKADGKTRTAYSVCITCWSTASDRRNETWETEPIAVIGREAERCGMGRCYASQTPERERLTNELHAIAALVAAHRDEFDEFIAGLANTTSLDAARRDRRRRAAR